MQGFLPFTKSFAGDVKMCPWKAAQHKIHGIKSRSGKAAQIGLITHKIAANIRKNILTLDEFLLKPGALISSDEFTSQERDDIVDMVKRAFSSDPMELSETEKKRVEIEEYFLVEDNKK